MNKIHIIFNLKNKYLLFAILILSMGLLLTSCFVTNKVLDTSVQATVSALNVQNTTVAQQATQIAIVQLSTSIAQTVSAMNQQVSQPTSPPPYIEVPTETATVIPPTEPAVTEVANENISLPILDWENIGWIRSESSKCYEPKKACWSSINYKVISTLTSKDSIYVDPNWQNPKLVFWNKYSSDSNITFGYIEIQSSNNAGWSRIKSLKGTKDHWYKEEIDLNEYRSQNVIIRFYSEPATTMKNLWTWGSTNIKYHPFSWWIYDINIVP
jgi:hypothetical protein